MKPSVDVVITSYNHEKFIAQAIEGVLAQRTLFPVRVIIGDDCSTDNSQAIIRSYPNVETILETRHLGIRHPNRVSIRGIKRCQAKYVALLDGDDYWIDPLKLQKQVDFLESHPDYALCFHSVNVLKDNPEVWPVNRPESSSLEDILKENFICTCSVMFRGEHLRDLPEWFYRAIPRDWPGYILSAQHGKIGFLSEVMASYRVHPKGAWSGRSLERQSLALVRMHETIDRHFGFRYHKTIAPQIIACWNELITLAGRSKRAEMYRYRLLTMKPLHRDLVMKAKLAMRMFTPSMYAFGKRALYRFNWIVLP